MIPNFLKKYELELKQYQRETIKIEAKALRNSILEDDLDRKTSKFLGLPFYPKSKVYPKDKNGKPMLLAAQLNFEEIPKLTNFPKNGILQLFLSATDWYNEESEIIYHHQHEMETELMNDFSFISENDYEEMPIFKIHQLKFERYIENGGLEDEQFDFQFGNLDNYEFMENLNKEEEGEFTKYFASGGHKLGGYADFTQSDPRSYRGRSLDDVQLLQIDSIGEIMFGDIGLGHIFIDTESLINKKFEKAYFTWDCC